MNKTLFKITDNRWVQRFFFPLAFINAILSYIKIRKESKILQETINANDSFFKAIGQLGFTPNGYFGELISAQPFEPGFGISDIEAIAQKTILSVIKKFVQDENLLGIINVDCRLVGQQVLTTIRPTSIPMLLGDIYDLTLGVIFWSIVTVILLYIV